MPQKPLTYHWLQMLAIGALLGLVLALALMWVAPTRMVYGLPLWQLPLWGVIGVGGVPLSAQIFRRILRGDWGADVLAALALITAVIMHETYAAALLVLMLAGGQTLEAMAARKASTVLAALAARMPSIAHRKTEAGVVDIPLAEIQLGDTVLAYPHEICPVDGTVLTGHGAMNEAYLTGEPYEVAKAPGATVLSGAINGTAALAIQVTALPQDSRYAQIMRVMEDAEQKRTTLRRLSDQLGAFFAPVALLCAGLAWALTGDAERFLAVLVIATPCPLLIAIPITVISAVSIAARQGIIIKDPTVLERLPTCRTAIFDKTGTLTYGQPELAAIVPASGADETAVLRLVAGLEQYSKHPLASAVLNAAKARGLVPPEAAQVEEKPGQGLVGTVDGQRVQITSRKAVLAQQPKAPLPPEAAGLEFAVLVDGQYAAVFQLRDKPRAEGKSFISHLTPLHHFDRIMLVSGDRATEVAYLADVMGIKDTYASQTPEQKLAIVRAETARQPTLYMGDGINDAPALAAATVGVAFGGANSITSAAAGAAVLGNTLRHVDTLLHISLAMRRIALQSAVGGMVLSFIGMGFAAAGYLPPVVGALLQEGIDILAILNALRLTQQRHAQGDM